MSFPDKFVIRTGGSNWRTFVPLLTADTTTNLLAWGPDKQYRDVNTGPGNEIAKQVSYFAGYWLNRIRASLNVEYSIPVHQSGGTFYFKATTVDTSDKVTAYQGRYTSFENTYYDLTVQDDGVTAGYYASGKAFSLEVNSGTAVISTSKKDVPGFPTVVMQTNSSWFVSAYFYTTSRDTASWKPIVGSGYTTVAQTGFWGIWLSNPIDYIHWRNNASPQFNGNTTLRVLSDEWHEVIVKYNPANKTQLNFALRKVYDNTTITRQTITQTADFSIYGVLGNVTSGGWELSTVTETFGGKVERVSIGVMPTLVSLSDLLRGSYPTLEVPPTFTFNTTSIGEKIMLNISKAGATLTSSDGSNVSITKVGTDNWSVTINTIGTYTLTYTFIDPNDFFPTITTSATVKLNALPATLTASKTVFYQKFVLSSTISFNVISSNAGAVSRTHESNNTAIVSIPSSSTPSATIVGPGKVTIKVTQPATSNYNEIINNALITIVIVGQGTAYTSEDMTSLDLSGTNLTSSTFSSCNLTSANIFGTTINTSTNFSTATLTFLKSGRIIGTTTLLPANFIMI